MPCAAQISGAPEDDHVALCRPLNRSVAERSDAEDEHSSLRQETVSHLQYESESDAGPPLTPKNDKICSKGNR